MAIKLKRIFKRWYRDFSRSKGARSGKRRAALNYFPDFLQIYQSSCRLYGANLSYFLNVQLKDVNEISESSPVAKLYTRVHSNFLKENGKRQTTHAALLFLPVCLNNYVDQCTLIFYAIYIKRC